MTTSVCTIEPSFRRVMDQVPCTGTCRLNSQTAVGLQDILQKILRMNTPNIQTNTYKEFIKNLTSEDYRDKSFIYFAHSVAMEKLFGKEKAVVLTTSIAPAMMDSNTWAPARMEDEFLISLVKEIGDTGDQEAIEYQLDVVKSLYKAGYISLASKIVTEVIKFDQRTIDSLVLFVQELVGTRYIDTASWVQRALMEAVSAFRESSSWVNLAEFIKAAREKAMHEQKQPPSRKGNVDIFSEVRKKVIDFYTARGLVPIEIKLEYQYGCGGYFYHYGASDEYIHGHEVLPSLAALAKKLIQSRMIDPLFEVAKAIYELNDNDAKKCCCIADIAVGLSQEERGDEYMARIITHDGQDTSVDVPLVCQIVRNLTQKKELKKALLLAEQYLQGSCLSTAFDGFAQELIKMDRDSAIQIELKQKGKLFVALVKELATIDLHKARDLIKRASDYSISEEDQIEAGIYLAKAAIEKKERVEDVLAELAHTVSPEGIDSERIKKAYIRLVEVLLINYKSWNEADKVINCLKGVVESEVIDSLLAKEVMAETKVVIEDARFLNRFR